MSKQAVARLKDDYSKSPVDILSRLRDTEVGERIAISELVKYE